MLKLKAKKAMQHRTKNHASNKCCDRYAFDETHQDAGDDDFSLFLHALKNDTRQRCRRLSHGYFTSASNKAQAFKQMIGEKISETGAVAVNSAKVCIQVVWFFPKRT